MPAIEIPDPLPPAITLPREVIEFAISQHLEEFGEHSLVARTWHWILHGGGTGPISHMDWSQFDGEGPPSAATLAAESTADQATSACPAIVGRTQQSQVYLLVVHSEPRGRGSAPIPHLRPRTHPGRHRLQVCRNHHA